MKYRAVISTRGSVGEVVENHNEATMSPQPTQHVRGETLMLSNSRTAKGIEVSTKFSYIFLSFFEKKIMLKLKSPFKVDKKLTTRLTKKTTNPL